MSRLPRLAPGAGLNQVKEYLNLLAAAIDAGGLQNLNSVTDTGITGQGLTPTFPASPGSTNPLPGSSGTPNTPTGLQLSYGIDNYHQTHDGYIVISWTPNPVADNIARYDIFWRKGSDANLHQLTVGGDVNLARINSVIPGLSYTFAIQAHDTAGRASSFSLEQSITLSLDVDPPAVPTGLTATAIGPSIVLTWTEVGSEGISNDLKQYQIAVSTDGGVTYPTVYTVGPGNYWIYDPTVATPFFKIATVDWTGNVSAYSGTVSATVSGTIFGSLTINPGPLTVSSGGINVTGNSTITGNLHVTGTSNLDGLITAGAGIGVTGGTTTDTLHVTGTSALNGDITAGARLLFSTAISKIIPGATSLNHRNNADSADNLILTDAGLGAMRNALTIPPSAGGTAAPTNYGTLLVKIAETDSSGSLVASITFSNLPSGFRNIRYWARARDGSAATTLSNLILQLNSDTGAHYYSAQITASTTVSGSNSIASTTALAGITTNGGITDINWFAPTQGTLIDYNGSQKKEGLWDAGGMNGGVSGNVFKYQGFWHWESTAAITSVTFFSNAAVTTIKAIIAIYGEP